MLNSFTKLLTKIFGTKSEKDLKMIKPILDSVNAVYAKIHDITDDELRGKTGELQERIQDKLKDIDGQIAGIREKIVADTAMDLGAKDKLFQQIDALEKDRNKKLEEVLMEVLPEAFSVMRETARRLKENKKLVVKATEHDYQIASIKSNVEIDGDNAIWHNKWLAAGSVVEWDMEHYDVQIIGGIVLHQGKVAEMATGEGKTLVATLPTYLNAIGKRGVHVVTVNDYLAKRDSEWMTPLFEFHKLSIDCIDKHAPHSPGRHAAYNADITYGTNNEFGFDYLRDNMSRSPDELVQRKHHYAMIDEVDSVLIDEARTPLIISGPVPRGDEHEFYELKPRVVRLVEEQRKLIQTFLTEAKKKLQSKDKTEAAAGALALFRAHRGLPKNKPLIKVLSESGNKQILLQTEANYLQENSKLMPEADKPLFFVIDERHNSVELTDNGIELITRAGEDPHFFIIPDIGTQVAEIEKNPALSDDQKLEQKEQLISDYTVKSQRIHTINQLLKAYTLFEKDTDYIVVDSKVMIVDEQTGRVLDGRRYSDGLHQSIEAKEDVKIEDATQTYATVTLQNYFRMYHKLAGMTGTAETEAGELMEIYKLDVVVIPTNRPIKRNDMQDMVFKTEREKLNAVADEIQKLTGAGRPVLVGTTSVEHSEKISRMLQMRKIDHQVLNAKHHAREAEVVAKAGFPSTVTIATNMAGRGTDIKLPAESKAAGGLAIIGTERHESRRVDRQLRGRAGRQGDNGSSQFFVSLEDGLMRLFGSDKIARVMDRLGHEEGDVIQAPMITKSIERAQKKVEENHFATRKRLLEYDDVMNSQREVVYKRRRNALYGERLAIDVMHMFYFVANDIVKTAKTNNEPFKNFALEVVGAFGINTGITEDAYAREKQEVLAYRLYQEVYFKHYHDKNKAMHEHSRNVFENILAERGEGAGVQVPMTDGKIGLGIMARAKEVIDTEGASLIQRMEQDITLMFIDDAWKQHLRDMDDLRQQVQNAVYEQKDPLLIYKFESFELFKEFLSIFNREIVNFLSKAHIETASEDQMEAMRRAQEAAMLERQRQFERMQAQLTAQKEAAENALPQPEAPVNTNGRTQSFQEEEAEKPKQLPGATLKIKSRNDRVSVQYSDGTVKRDVKYKAIEQDIMDRKCVLIEVL